MSDSWYVAINGQRQGPLSPAQLKQMASAGLLGPADLLWKEGMSEWIRCDTVKGLLTSSGQAGGVQKTGGGPPRLAPPRVGAIPPQAPRMVPRIASAPPPIGGPPGLVGTSLTGFPPTIGTTGPTIAVPTVPVSLPTEPLSVGTQAFEYAEFMPRVGATILDGLFLALVGCVPVGLIGVAVVIVGNANAADPMAVAIAQGILQQLVALLVGGCYFILSDSSGKQGTWGKQIVGIKVTDMNGNRVTAGRATGRYCAKFLSNCTCGIAYLMPLFTERKQTLHDMVSGCLVLKK
jgi:uncharacterized RDD family membrane protein YckC